MNGLTVGGWVYRWMVVRKDGWIYGQMDIWTDGYMDG